MKHELMTLAERIVPAEVADEIISLVEQEHQNASGASCGFPCTDKQMK